MIEHQITTIAHLWKEVCDEADLSPVDRKLFAGRQFLNSYALDGLDNNKALQDAFRAAHNTLLASERARG